MNEQTFKLLHQATTDDQTNTDKMVEFLKTIMTKVGEGKSKGIFMVCMFDAEKEDGVDEAMIGQLTSLIASNFKQSMAHRLLEAIDFGVQRDVMPAVMAGAELVAVLVPVGAAPEGEPGTPPESPLKH